MLRPVCEQFYRPLSVRLEPPKPDELSQGLARELAVDVAALIVEASKDEGDAPRCGLPGKARTLLDRLDEKARDRVLEAFRPYATRASRDDATIRKEVSSSLRDHIGSRMPEIKKIANQAFERARDVDRQMTLVRTHLSMRAPSDEFRGASSRRSCSAQPQTFTFDWETTEPGAERVYWEMRGPVAAGDPGRLLAYGVSENSRTDAVGGSFTLRFRDYLSPVTPAGLEEYHVRVLPIGPGNSMNSLVTSTHSVVIAALDEPQPPSGLGEWSRPAVFGYGTDCADPGIRLPEPVYAYRRALVRFDTFEVQSDQPGPGDEEYHVRAFVSDILPTKRESLGTFTSYLPIQEGDTSRHPLGWRSFGAELYPPETSAWPRILMAVLSVLEEDSGDFVNEFHQLLFELSRELMFGELGDEIQEILQKIRDEVAQQTEEAITELTEDGAKWAAETISEATSTAIVGWILLVVRFLYTFIKWGSEDDFYGIEIVFLELKTNDSARIKDETGWSTHGGTGSSTGHAPSSDRYHIDNVGAQLFGLSGPDSAGLDGIVKLRIGFELFDLRPA